MRRFLLVPYQVALEVPPYFLNLRGTRKNTVQHLHGTRIDSAFTRIHDGANETTIPLNPADPRLRSIGSRERVWRSESS
jgi:hypothetical protein